MCTVQTLSLALDLANLRELPLALPGVELEGVRVQRAALQQMVVARLQQRLFGIAVSVLRSSGVFGSASKVCPMWGCLRSFTGGAEIEGENPVL
eukprot:1158533-Pelagomonas_calceolata.AAC.7